jgi:ribosomal protein S18 acetylase RimI-like enzyme
MRRLLEVHPGRSVWVPATLEYALIGPWRNRPEIGSVEELVAVRHLEELLRAAVERCAEQGDELVLTVELDSRRSPARYERAGLEMLEEVITYQLGIGREPWSGSAHIRLGRVDPRDEEAVNLVTSIDRASFPWLWRNNRAEFDVYLDTPGVEVWLVEADGEPVAYFGVTLFPDWGHLDRVAVVPNLQGRGFGLETLGLAVDTMRQRGGRRVGLSTQRTNRRSQRLYERFGFQRTPEHDYRLFGAWCQAERHDGLLHVGHSHSFAKHEQR